MAALKPEEFLGTAEDAVGLALKKGAVEAEVFVNRASAKSVGIEQGQIVRSSSIVDQGLGVRVVINKAIGFSYTNVVGNRDAVENVISAALSAARASKPDEDWHGFAAEKPFASVPTDFDRRIVALGSEDLVRIAGLMLDSAEKTDTRAYPIEGGVGASCLFEAVANSNGVAGFDKATAVECSLATVGNDKGDATPVCFEFDMGRRLDVNAERVGREAARLAVQALKAKKIETKSMSVIFTQTALQELLYYTLVNAVGADNVQRNQSALKGKVGEVVASEVVTIYDDGLLEGGLHTGIFDGEGVPSQKTPIIEKGVLKGFLYDNYWAKKEGKESTGNASRAGYLSTPTIDASNFHVLPGNESTDELVGEVDEGLLVYLLQGAHSSNPSSGEFSVVAAPSWKIEKGEIKHAVKGAMLSGNVFELLKNVVGLANNERKIGFFVAPWVLAENVKVVGK